MENKITVKAEFVGKNSGCGDCGNERVDLYYIEADAIPSRQGWGCQYLCKKCMKALEKKDGIKFVVA